MLPNPAAEPKGSSWFSVYTWTWLVVDLLANDYANAERVAKERLALEDAGDRTSDRRPLFSSLLADVYAEAEAIRVRLKAMGCSLESCGFR